MRFYLDVIGKRRDLIEHLTADCGLLVDKPFAPERMPAFFYGIAHILKHHCRRKAEEIQTISDVLREDLKCLETSPTSKVGTAANGLLTMLCRQGLGEGGKLSGACVKSLQIIGPQTSRKGGTIREVVEEFQQKKADLARSVGWADEFFWLAVWAETGILKGAPDLRQYENKVPALFLLTLVHMEWGDLIRFAWFFHRNRWVDSEFPGEGVDRFGIWSPVVRGKRRNSLMRAGREWFKRADDRFKKAEEGLGLLRHRRESALRKSVSNDLEGHLCMGKTGIAWASGKYEKAIEHLNEALKAPNVMTNASEGVKAFVRDEQPRKDFDKVTFDENAILEESLTAIHILAEWVEDLLKNGFRGGSLHPKLTLPKKDRLYNRDVTTFPNYATITYIQDLLKKNLAWLNFTRADNGKLWDYIKDVEKRNRMLHGKMFTSSPRWKECGPDVWRLFVLRDWGSFTPLLPDSLRQESEVTGGRGGGGGYFLQWKDRGVVIDPGFDYIPHFYEAGLSPDMITDVIVTHDHYDHAASFGPLLNLLFKDRKQPESRGYEKNVSFYLSRGVFDQYARFIVDCKYFQKIEPLTDEDKNRGRRHTLGGDSRLRLFTTHTEHGDKNGFGVGVGLVFKFEGKHALPTLGITSDTSWYDEWDGQGKKNREDEDGEVEGKAGDEKDSKGEGEDKNDDQSLGKVFAGHKPAVLVLHVGSLKADELVDSGFYKTHLGARGVFRTIDAVKSCRLALLSEFGEECRKWRTPLAEKYTKHFRKDRDKPFRCFPSDRRTLVVARAKDEILIGRNDGKGDLAPYADANVEEVGEHDAAYPVKEHGTFKFV